MKRFKIKSNLKYLGLILLMVVAVAFAEKKYENRTCSDVKVYIENEKNNILTDNQEIIQLMTAQESDDFTNKNATDLPLKSFENRIKNNPYVEKSSVFTDIKGDLLVNLQRRTPIIGLIGRNGSRAYLASDGTVLPLPKSRSKRLTLADGSGVIRIMNGEVAAPDLEKITKCLNFIYENPFWNAMIPRVSISGDLEIILYPQIGPDKVLFGTAENKEAKFQKLEVFYKNIMPVKGNTYNKVDLRYEGQVVCE